MQIKNSNKELLFKQKLFSDIRPFKAKSKFSEQYLLDLAQEEMLKKEVEIPSLIRTEFGFRKKIDEGKELRKLFQEKKLRPIKWLHQARRQVLKIKLKKTGKHHIYAVLLDYGHTRYPYGIYIGESKYQIENRFSQHLEGIRSSRSVKNHGTEILYSMITHLNFPSNLNKYAQDLEAEVVEKLMDKTLKLAGLPYYRVKGGHLYNRKRNDKS